MVAIHNNEVQWEAQTFYMAVEVTNCASSFVSFETHTYINTYVRQYVILFMVLVSAVGELATSILLHKCRQNKLSVGDMLHSWISYFRCETYTTGHHVTKWQGQRASRIPSVSSPGAHACYLTGQLRKQLMWAVVGMY